MLSVVFFDYDKPERIKNAFELLSVLLKFMVRASRHL